MLSLVLSRAWSAATNCPSIDNQPMDNDNGWGRKFAPPEEYVEMVQCWGQDYIFSRTRADKNGGCHDQTGALSRLLAPHVTRMSTCSRLNKCRDPS